ncbi:MAG: hypothetical protein ABEL76_04810 [Bradymonadaceae bacterium]
MSHAHIEPTPRSSLAVGLVAVSLLLSTTARTGVSADAEKLRSYSLPEGVSLRGAHIDSTRQGTTLIANTKGRGKKATCAVVLARGDSTSTTEYQHDSKGTGCKAVLPHPDGGFFIRGKRASADKDEIAGFTARVGADGSEKWFVGDRSIAESDDFKGKYVEPHGVMAYSRPRGKLLVTTLGKISIGELDEKAVTNVSVVSDGRLSVQAQTIGRSGAGFGRMGGAEILESSGDFLVYVYVQGRRGAEFFAYDGRQSVDLFEPMGESWSDRYVEKVVYGPEGRIHLLWTAGDGKQEPTRLSVVDQKGEKVWSESYEATIRQGGEEQKLGRPAGLWVGSKYSVVLYKSDSALLRVVDVQAGTALGVVKLGELTDHVPFAILNGKEGRLKLLAFNRSAKKIVEYRLGFEETGGDGPDAGIGDAGPDAGGESGGGGGGCRAAGSESPVLPGMVALFGLVGILRRRTRT